MTFRIPPHDLTHWMEMVRRGKVQALKKEFVPQHYDGHDWVCLFSQVYQTTLSKADKILGILIEKGGDINAVNGHGVTTLEELMHVCFENTVPYLDLLVKHGASIMSIQEKLIGLAASHGRAPGLVWLDKQGVNISLCRGEKTWDIFKEWADECGEPIPDDLRWLLCEKEFQEHLKATLPQTFSKPSKRV